MIASYMKTSIANVILRLSGRELIVSPESEDLALEVAEIGGFTGSTLLIRGSQNSLQRLSQTASLGAPDCYPIAAFAQTFDKEFFGEYSMPKDSIITAADPEVAKVGAYIAVGELFTYLNEEKNSAPSPIVSLYSRTYAYALTRSTLLWGSKRSRLIFERWMLLRQRLGLSPTRSLQPRLVDSVITPWLENRSDIPWMDEVETAMANDNDLLSTLCNHISARLEINLGLPPQSFDQRFEWLAAAAGLLRENKVDPIMGSLALGLLVAATEPGELMHLNWLRIHLKAFPQVGICYAAWSAVLSHRMRDKPPVLRGLIKILERELQRPLDLSQAPLEDASLIDLMASSKPLNDVQLRASHKSFSISIVPGVIFHGGYAQPSEPNRSNTAAVTAESILDNRQQSIFSGDEMEFRRTVLRELAEMRRLVVDVVAAKRKTVKKT